MSKLKTHAKRHLSYDPQTSGVVWTRCFRNVEQPQIAAVEPEGVTCKKCLASLEWDQRAERIWAAHRAAREENAQ